MQSPREIRTAAIAYFVWCMASRAEWDLTLHELSDAAAAYFKDETIGVPVIQGICRTRRTQGKTWMQLIRCTTPAETPGFLQ